MATELTMPFTSERSCSAERKINDKRNRLLVIVTKNSEAGLVKTRLAQTIGNKRALEVHEILQRHTARIAAQVNAERKVFYSSFIPDSDIFITCDFSQGLQNGKDLGERMLHALGTGFEEGFKHVILIGTDCYELNPEILEEAFTSLEHYNTVIGPATDGGFYLVGMNKVHQELFLQRQWSTSGVLAESIAILERLGATYKLLVELPDIDTVDDLKKSSLWTNKTNTQ